MLWCGILLLSIELTNHAFTDVAFGASHTYSHWRKTTRNTRSVMMGRQHRDPASKDPMLRGENLFLISFLREHQYKTDDSGVLAGGLLVFVGTQLFITSFGKFILYKRLGV